MTGPDWVRIVAPSYFSIYCPRSLLPTMRRVLRAMPVIGPNDEPQHFDFETPRHKPTPDAVVVKIDQTSKFSVDMPGMCRTDRPWQTIELPGVAIEVPCEDVESIAYYLNKAKAVSRFGRTWCEGSFFHRSIVLPIRMRKPVVDAIRAALPEAQKRQAEFEADKDLTVQKAMRAGTHGMGPNGLVPIPGREGLS